MPRQEIKLLNPLCVPLQECMFKDDTRAPQWLDDIICGTCSMSNYGSYGLKPTLVFKCLRALPVVSTSTVFEMLYNEKYMKYNDESKERRAGRYSAACRHVIDGLRDVCILPRFNAWRDAVTKDLDEFKEFRQ